MHARIFISYAREDEKTANALAEHLDQLKSLGVAETWIDRDIELGRSWEATISEQTQQADVVLLLVSHDYLASGFAHDQELKLIEQASDRGARVIPVIIGECAWRSHPFIGSLQAFARGRRMERPTTVTFQRQAAELVEELGALLRQDAATSAASAREPVSAPSPPPADGPVAPSSGRSTVPATKGRVDENGLAYKGSQLQTQLYVNALPDGLNRSCIAMVESLPRDAEIEWRSPLRRSGYAEHKDADFLRALGLERLESSLADFWPAGGPRWDALAVVKSDSLSHGAGVILAEGKSYPQEMRSTTRAKGDSREKIARAIAGSQQALGVRADPEAWMTGYYQLANRLAHMVWLRSEGVEAWFASLLFVNDPHRPTTAGDWAVAMTGVRATFGIASSPWIGEVPLGALDRSLLES